MSNADTTVRTEPPHGPGVISSLLHRVGDVTSLAATSIVVILAVTAFLTTLAFAGFPESWQIASPPSPRRRPW